MSVAKNIMKSVAYGADVSSEKDLEEYFAAAAFDDKMWPLDFEKEGVKTEYLCAHILPDKFGISDEIHLGVKFLFGEYDYTLSERISAEDGLEIEFNSLVRQGGVKKDSDKFVYNLLNKHYKFMKEYAAKNDINPQDAKLKIHAHSGAVEDVKTSGGYVWATYGFEFSCARELESARRAFQRFAKKHNIQIEDKDLKYFKYPCHFAAFDSKEKVDGNSLGKAFLLQYEWYGERRGDMSEKSESFRYQKAYHEKGKEAAKSELSKGFLAVLNKYNYKCRSKENIIEKLLMLKDRFLQK